MKLSLLHYLVSKYDRQVTVRVLYTFAYQSLKDAETEGHGICLHIMPNVKPCNHYPVFNCQLYVVYAKKFCLDSFNQD